MSFYSETTQFFIPHTAVTLVLSHSPDYRLNFTSGDIHQVPHPTESYNKLQKQLSVSKDQLFILVLKNHRIFHRNSSLSLPQKRPQSHSDDDSFAG
ncbi:hypothetical protein CHISP_0004 [Chitinispirillum alkaliphilum]|nr:hypothetical protein CHISP_0004 [Chitinispirillum alkaliphilum]